MKYSLYLIALLVLSSLSNYAQNKKVLGFSEHSSFGETIICKNSLQAKASGDQHWDHKFDSTNSPNGPVYAIATVDSFVYVGGSFTKIGSIDALNIARWDGHSWSALGSGLSSDSIVPVVSSIVIKDDEVYAGGFFTNSGTTSLSNIAKWDGANWYSLGSGTDNPVYAIAIDQNGNLFAGGCFTTAGGIAVSHIAEWQASVSTWKSIGNGVSGGLVTKVNSLVIKDSLLIIGGDFANAGGNLVNNIAVWNGTVWAGIGTGTNGPVKSVAIKGTDFYAAGEFTMAGGTAANHYAKWNGSVWADVDGGVDYAPACIYAVPTDVYVASSINSLGFNHITKYDCCWDPFGSGLNNTAEVISVKGKDVWVGGMFHQAGGKQSYHFAHWNGTVDFSSITEKNHKNILFSVYPNPACKKINIEFELDRSDNIFFTIFDISGKKVLSKSIFFAKGNISTSIDIHDLATGNYLVELSGNGFSSCKKVIIK
jgi:hypothetical protein